MQKRFISAFAPLLDLLFPPRRTESAVRGLSIEDLFSMATPGGPLPYRDKRVTALVWELKYRGNARAAALAGEFLADQLLSQAGEELGVPLIIPMPMHRARRRERGFNQTELLCEAAVRFAKDSFHYAPVLERVRNTAPQQSLARNKRLINLKNSMHVKDPALVRGRVCIVVDDVSTTGASFAEAKRALIHAHARAVHFVPLAVS